MRIISLTSIPPRFGRLEPTLRNLLAQAADEVRLYIPQTYRRFPDWDGTLPQVPAGVRLIRCAVDDGPATKVLPAVRDLRGQDVQILFCDDDSEYHPHWAERLFSIQARRPHETVAVRVSAIDNFLGYRVRTLGGRRPLTISRRFNLPFQIGRLLQRIGGPAVWQYPVLIGGYADLFFGVAGVVVRPEFLDEQACNLPDHAWFQDDIWLAANLARRGIAIYCPARTAYPRPRGVMLTASLMHSRIDGLNRHELNRRIIRRCRDELQIWGPA